MREDARGRRPTPPGPDGGQVGGAGPEGLDGSALSAWLWLLALPGVGRDGARRLLAHFGAPQAVLAADAAALRGLMPAEAAERLAPLLATPPDGHAERVARALAWRQAAPRRQLLVLGDAAYPPLLLHTADPPLLLYLEGDVRLLQAPSVALVGSRHATPQGRDNARAFARALCEAGWTVVSGLAAGIDAAAHEGALAARAAGSQRAGASTVAVVGTGLDIVYPRANQALAARVAEAGLLVSELPLGAPPLAAHFPQRNRIIAGLSRGTVVVEAALASGSLITARMALESGREVMAVPGSIHAPGSRGCHQLIRQGAALVTSAQEVLAELQGLPPLALAGGEEAEADGEGEAGIEPGAGPATDRAGEPAQDRTEDTAPGTSGRADPVLRALGHDPASLDQLIDRCGWPSPQLSAHLLTLELQGLVVRLPGGLYQRLVQA